MDKINVDKAIENLFTKLEKDPYLMYSEEDLKHLLSMEIHLMDNTPYPTKNETGTYRVHREYPYGAIRSNISHDFDIVVFCKEDIHKINRLLFVDGENPDGTTIKQEGKKEIKRSTFCSHLIELKKSLKGTIKKDVIDIDFEVLIEGYNIYRHFREVYNVDTQLYFICYINWNPKDDKYIVEQIKIFSECFKNAEGKNNKPPIKFYLLIGPKDRWEHYFQKESDITNYLYPPEKKIYFV